MKGISPGLVALLFKNSVNVAPNSRSGVVQAGTISAVTITLNGDAHTVAGPLTVAGLLAHLEIDPRGVAVERNFVVIKRDAYATTAIEEGDQIEIVNFVGGG